jgi:hypothetical protein
MIVSPVNISGATVGPRPSDAIPEAEIRCTNDVCERLYRVPILDVMEGKNFANPFCGTTTKLTDEQRRHPRKPRP